MLVYHIATHSNRWECFEISGWRSERSLAPHDGKKLSQRKRHLITDFFPSQLQIPKLIQFRCLQVTKLTCLHTLCAPLPTSCHTWQPYNRPLNFTAHKGKYIVSHTAQTLIPKLASSKLLFTMPIAQVTFFTPSNMPSNLAWNQQPFLTLPHLRHSLHDRWEYRYCAETGKACQVNRAEPPHNIFHNTHKSIALGTECN